MFPASLRDADHLSADADPTFVQRLDSNLVAFSDLAQNIVFGNFAIFQDQFASARGPNTQLVLLFPDRETLKVPFHEESRNAFVPLIRVRVREHDKDAGFDRIRNPEFPAIKNEMIPFVHGAAGQRKRIAAGPRLG